MKVLISSWRSKNCFSTLSRFSHCTYIWYKMSPYSLPTASKRDTNRRWWRDLERIKFTALNTTSMMPSICRDLLHSASWCKMQWTAANWLAMPSVMSFVHNRPTSPLLHPTIDGAQLVAKQTNFSHGSPACSITLSRTERISAPVVVPFIVKSRSSSVTQVFVYACRRQK